MAFAKKDEGLTVIPAANIVRIVVPIGNVDPYVQARFADKARHQMMATMTTPANQKKSRTARPVRDFDEDYDQSQHRTASGDYGIPCAAFRRAMVDACRTINLPMTRAKMAVFVIADGFDARDGIGLVRLEGTPERHVGPVRNANGSIDIRVRTMFRQWRARVTVDFDGDMITAESVVHLLDRAGRQVGVGEGRPFSTESCGVGWGTFRVEESKHETSNE